MQCILWLEFKSGLQLMYVYLYFTAFLKTFFYRILYVNGQAHEYHESIYRSSKIDFEAYMYYNTTQWISILK